MKKISLLLLIAILLGLTGCKGTEPEPLKPDSRALSAEVRELDKSFRSSQIKFGVELLQSAAKTDTGKNVLVSPLSAMLALAMTANGADADTRTEMEALLGDGLTIEELNEYLYSYVKQLPSSKKGRLELANSIWFRDEKGLSIEDDFLRTNETYYDAEIFKSAFDNQTLNDINGWIEKKTDGMIDKVLDKIPEEAIMYLINALVFDGEWEEIYKTSQVHEANFTSFENKTQSVDMMYSEVSKYLEMKHATGFLKPYKGSDYYFAALLPEEAMSIEEFVAGLSPEELFDALQHPEETSVDTAIPKFEYDYDILLNDSLKELGIPTAFDPGKADFGRLGHSSKGNIFIGNVLQKTFISVDEKGTKAGAVTVVEMKCEGAMIETHQVYLDRPFVYMIVDGETRLPVFMGIVKDLN